MSDKNDDINLKIFPVKKTKKSLLAKITSARSFGVIDAAAIAAVPVAPLPATFPVAPLPATFPVAPMPAPLPSPIVAPAPIVLATY